MKVEVEVQGSPSLIVRKANLNLNRVQELRESRGGRPGLPVPNSSHALRGRKVTLNLNKTSELKEKSKVFKYAK